MNKVFLMPKKFSELGFVPLITLILVVVIGTASVLIGKNIPMGNFQPSADKGFQGSSSALLKVKTSPTVASTKSQTAKSAPSPTKVNSSPTPTSAPSNQNSNSNTNPTNNPTSSPTTVPTNTPTSTPMTAGYGTVNGKVQLMQSNGAPIPLAGVPVNLTCDNCNKLYNGNNQSTSTDSNGNFTFNNVPATVDIELITLAYSKISNPIKINLTPGQNLTKDIYVTLPTN